MEQRKGGPKVQLIDTPAGPMTRRQAANYSGIALGTIIRRIWEGCPPHLLFASRDELIASGALQRRAGAHGRKPDSKRNTHATANYVEKWKDRKKCK